ncbi:MAG: molybdopterin-dependent oxidoreductase, partial [Chloroflexi bacterium]|nr:molybdopterin-dependent oxidoreductase [Chloroflexota bacterium]
ALAMSIAYVILNEGRYDAGFVANWTSGFSIYRQAVLDARDEEGKPYYHPENVARITGISADTIWQIAVEFAQTKPAIAWVGRGVTDWPNGAYTSYAIFCLNALAGSIDVPGGIIYQENPKYRDMPEIAEDDIAREGGTKPRIDLAFPLGGIFSVAQGNANHVPDSILSGNPYPVELALGFNSNFNMSAPGAERWGEALKRVPYYVHVAPVLTEMAEYADLLLPASTFLETWAYDHSPPGSGFAELKLKQPVVAPPHDTKGVADIIFDIARQLGGTVARPFSQIGDSADGFVKYRTEALVRWPDLQANGVWVGPPYEYRRYDRIFATPSGKFEFYSNVLQQRFSESGRETASKTVFLPHYEVAKFIGENGDYPLALSTYQPLLTVESGNQNYPWAQQIFMVMHGVGWVNFAELNSRTARDLGIREGDMVWVESPSGKVRAKARVIEGIHPEVVSIAFGQGHHAGGRWQKGIGANPNEVIGVDYDRLSGQASFFNTRVKVYRA